MPIIRIERLSDAQAKAFIIADNRLCELGTWDERVLAEQLKALSKLAVDFSIETTGFDMGEIDVRIESLSHPRKARASQPKMLPYVVKYRK